MKQTKLSKTLSIYTLSHFLVDLVCMSFVVLKEQAFSINDFNILLIPLLYNCCAFALQMPVGAFCDLSEEKPWSAVGCILIIIGLLLHKFTFLALIFIGIGNSFFHVGGGKTLINLSHNNPKELGIFVSSGAIGVFLANAVIKDYNQVFNIILLLSIIVMLVDGYILFKTNKISTADNLIKENFNLDNSASINATSTSNYINPNNNKIKTKSLNENIQSRETSLIATYSQGNNNLTKLNISNKLKEKDENSLLQNIIVDNYEEGNLTSHCESNNITKETNMSSRLDFYNSKYILITLIIALCMFSTIVLRAVIGDLISFPWKNGFLIGSIWTLGIVTGKAMGGILANKYGYFNIGIIGSLLSLVLLSFGNIHPVVGIIGIFTFNWTMPITLCLLVNLLWKNPGFAFGLTTFALFLGGILSQTKTAKLILANIHLSGYLIISGIILVIGIYLQKIRCK